MKSSAYVDISICLHTCRRFRSLCSVTFSATYRPSLPPSHKRRLGGCNMDFIHAKLACRRADPAIIPKGFWDSDQNALAHFRADCCCKCMHSPSSHRAGSVLSRRRNSITRCRSNTTTMSHCTIPPIDACHLYISPRCSSALEQRLQRPQAGPFSQDGRRR